MTAGERTNGGGAGLLRLAVHDLQTRLGSVHIAITAVCDLDFEPKTQAEMLETASEETLRASAEVGAIANLASCLLDDTEPAARDIAGELIDVVELCRLTGLDAQVVSSVPAVVRTADKPLHGALESLVRVVAGVGRHLTASVEVVDDRAVVSLVGDVTNGDGDGVPQVATFLVAALGGRVEPADIGLSFSMALAS